MNGGAGKVTLKAEALVPQATSALAVARRLAVTLAVLVPLGLWAPWQQSVSGVGRVLAYAPVERRQNIEAPISGRVARWLVREGSAVREGEPLLELQDNDPQYLARLGLERQAVQEKFENYEERVVAFEQQVTTAIEMKRSDLLSVQAKLRASIEKLSSIERKQEAAEAALETAMVNLGRVRALSERGLSAQRDLELAQLGATKARTDRDGAQADVQAARGDLDAARAALDKARADGDAKIQEAEAKLRSARSDLADSRSSRAKVDVSIARQDHQLVRAPRAGVIQQVLVAQGAQQIKQGDVLAVLVPDTSDRAVEVWIDGNDAAIVSAGRHVRLQFEGWPAVQFTGWPAVAVGTFGGVISFIDPQDDGQGNFRLLVVPDPAGEPWPSPRFLRQGVRTKAWVLLERVSLGFELWRRFNGFPPMLERAPDAENDSKAESKGGKK